jgi:CBS domain-containing protein
MNARDLMTSPAVPVPPEAPREAVAAPLRSHGIAAVPVVDADAHLLGTVDETDLVRTGPAGIACELMRQRVDAVAPNTPVSELAVRLAAGPGRAVVVDSDGDVLHRVARGQVAPLIGGSPARTSAAVVVGVDGSEASVVALRWAMDEASRTGSPVRAVIVYGPPELYGSADTLERHARQVLDEALEKALGSGAAAVTREVREGHPVPAPWAPASPSWRPSSAAASRTSTRCSTSYRDAVSS